MGASGTVIIDFGPFPGQSDASVTVSAPGIATTSLVEAWIFPDTTADHSPDEHTVETLTVKADRSSIIANTSFVISVANTSQLDDDLYTLGGQGVQNGGMGTLIYGKWNLGWVWD
jgi:hypothetical protein